MAARVKATTGTAPVELNRIENSYTATTLTAPTATTPGRSFVALAQSLEQSRELDGTAMPAVRTSYQYDGFGNATEVTVETGVMAGASFTGDGYSKVTTNSYTNDVNAWLLGRLTRAVVASTTPN